MKIPRVSLRAFCGTAVTASAFAIVALLSFRSGVAEADYQRGANLLADRGLPVSESMRRELFQMRATNRLTEENERTLDKTVRLAGRELQMPPAALYCLMFQESRLNHLNGIDATSGATGIGQFLFPSFYEVNFHLDRYTDTNKKLFLNAFGGKDVRPIGAFRADRNSPSSYYSLQTGVVATATYLNNRHEQLRRPLLKTDINYNDDLLWLQSAMAYNKGGRSVFLLWKELRARLGAKKFQKLMTDPQAFLATATDEELLRSVLGRIWSPTTATEFAKEWRTHLGKLAECSVATPFRRARGRSLAAEE